MRELVVIVLLGVALAASAAEQPKVKGGEGVRALSGMSILGNEEAPKSLVIVPWRSSELADDVTLSDTLDDRARPVDKEVFLRELRFYDLRTGANEDEGGGRQASRHW